MSRDEGQDGISPVGVSDKKGRRSSVIRGREPSNSFQVCRWKGKVG